MRSWFAVMACLVVWSVPAGAQWIGYPTPGIPRTADGKPNLTAPAPRGADGKIDLSGIWLTPSARWLQNLAADGVEVPFRPATKALYDERRANNGKGRPSERCISHGVTDFDALGTPTKIHPDARRHRGAVRSLQPLSPDLHRRPSAAGQSPAGLARLLGGQVGRRHVRRRDDRLERHHLAGRRRAAAQRGAARHRAVHAARLRPHGDPDHHRRPAGVHEAVDASRSPRTSWSTTS